MAIRFPVKKITRLSIIPVVILGPLIFWRQTNIMDGSPCGGTSATELWPSRFPQCLDETYYILRPDAARYGRRRVK